MRSPAAYALQRTSDLPRSPPGTDRWPQQYPREASAGSPRSARSSLSAGSRPSVTDPPPACDNRPPRSATASSPRGDSPPSDDLLPLPLPRPAGSDSPPAPPGLPPASPAVPAVPAAAGSPSSAPQPPPANANPASACSPESPTHRHSQAAAQQLSSTPSPHHPAGPAAYTGFPAYTGD